MLELDKAEYFAQLYALNESSDDEGRGCDDPSFFKKVPPLSTKASSFPSRSPQRTERRGPKATRKSPGIQRNTSAPTSSISKEEPILQSASLAPHSTSNPPSKSSLSRISSPIIATSASSQRADPEGRTPSEPNRGSLVLKNSTGIVTMLQKKQKRKRDSFTLVPEAERIFQGLRFFYLPADDRSAVRRARISKARSYGAVWEKQLESGITHVIVDSTLSYKETMDYLKPNFGIETLPKDVILVNEEYPVDCISFRIILDPYQDKYAVKGSRFNSEQQAKSLTDVQAAEEHREVKCPRNKVVEHGSERQTPPRLYSLSPARELENSLKTKETPRDDSPRTSTQTRQGFSNALDEMIELMQRSKHLPLDDDSDERPSSSSSTEDPGDSDHNGQKSPIRQPKKKRKVRAPKASFNQENFSCMRGGTGITTASNPNARTIEVLQEMADIYDRLRDTWRSRAYRMAIGTLKTQAHKISTYNDAIVLPAIGDRLAEKIEEIALTDGLRRLEYAKQEPNDRILQAFLQIYGVGLSQASAWMQQGHKTLEDLREYVHLTDNQKIGIEHYEDFNTRIPREQVTALGEIVKKAVADIDPEVQLTIGGSYRRGSPTSGDIDFILTKAGTSSTTPLVPFLEELVYSLTNSKFLVAALAVPRSEGASKWHGACVLPGNPIWRRIDFLLVPGSELGAALIYFTGDDIFNRSLRLLASRKGWRLNQRGLYEDVMRGPGRAKITEGTLIEAADEKKIFQALGVPYRPPEQRVLH